MNRLRFCTAKRADGKRCKAPAAVSRNRNTCGAHIDAYRRCACDCGPRTFKGPVCKVCLACAGCASAYDYSPNLPGAPPPTKTGKCPGCRRGPPRG